MKQNIVKTKTSPLRLRLLRKARSRCLLKRSPVKRNNFTDNNIGNMYTNKEFNSNDITSST